MNKTKWRIIYPIILIVTTVLSTNTVIANPVWKCTSASGQIKFQDSPCLDSDKKQQQVDTSKGNTIAAVPVTHPNLEQAVKLKPAKTKQQTSPQNQLSLSTCLKYKYELEKIDAEMRAGYSVRRGERLKLSPEAYRFIAMEALQIAHNVKV
ncbi:MAG: DUF4124 domain-containing protein [Methylophaga sp.]|nr:DUF4124 domain-containing protein [Methylophaga sp.]